MSHREFQRGLSLIEALISLTIGLFIVGALITYFVSGNRNYFQDREQSLMQENARYALKQLSDDIAMLGFFGHSINPPVSIAATITPDNDCLRTGASWPLGGTRLALLDHVAAEEQFSCIASGSLKAGTQVLAVNRAEGRASTDVSSSDDAGNVFIRTSPTEAGTLLVAPDASAILGGEYWRYISHIYYIVDEPTEDGLSTIPVLHRKTLRLDPDDGLGMHDTPGGIARGIEHIYVEFGVDIDPDPPPTGGEEGEEGGEGAEEGEEPPDEIGFIPGCLPDGMANFYTEDVSDPARFGAAITARIYVLARSRAAITGYNDNKSYNIGDASFAGDNYYRRVFVTTVRLRNQFSRYYLGKLMSCVGAT